MRKQFGVQELGCSDTMLEIEEHSEEQEREMFNLESKERDRVKKENLICLIDLLMGISHIYRGYKYGKW